MASRPWTEEDREFLRGLSNRRDWIALAMVRFTDRSEASVRCAMQKVRIADGTAGEHWESPWVIDARRGSEILLARLEATGLRPA